MLSENGKQGLAAWQEQPFDLILMDVQMPEMDGFEATGLIRKQEAIGKQESVSERKQLTKTHIPIIAMTAQPWSAIVSAVSQQEWTITFRNL